MFLVKRVKEDGIHHSRNYSLSGKDEPTYAYRYCLVTTIVQQSFEGFDFLHDTRINLRFLDPLYE